jgi:hypothetical protein
MTSFLSILAKSSGAVDQNLAVDKGNNGDVLISTTTGFSFVAANTLTPNLSQVLFVGNTATNNINLNGNVSANTFIGNLTGTASNATTATTATNIAGGSGGSIPYQSAASTTALLANGLAGQVLVSQGTTLAPVWGNTTLTSNITNTNSNATYYPIFVSGSGSQILNADITTTPLTYNPGTGFFTTRYLYNQIYYFAQKTYATAQTFGTNFGVTLTIGTVGSGSGLPSMLTSATSIPLPVGLAGWYRATASWIIPGSNAQLAQYFITIRNNNIFLNLDIATQDFQYTNGGSGFGPVQGGGTMTAVFNSNSVSSESIVLILSNPAFGITISNIVLTVEFIGGNI